jgi:hypothetical protein
MSRKFELPTFKGTIAFPNPTAPIPKYRVNIGVDAALQLQYKELCNGLISKFVQGQRQHYGQSTHQFWKKITEYKDLRLIYTNIQGQESILIEPKVNPEREELVPTGVVPDYMTVDLNMKTIYRKADVGVKIGPSETALSSTYTGWNFQDGACTTYDSPVGTLTRWYVERVYLGWMDEIADIFDMTAEQFEEYESSFRAEPYASNGASSTVYYRDSSLPDGPYAIAGGGEAANLPSGRTEELTTQKYQGNQSTNWDSFIAPFEESPTDGNNPFHPVYRYWTTATGGHPIEDWIATYYEQEGITPPTNPRWVYQEGTTATLNCAWYLLTGPYCIGYTEQAATVTFTWQVDSIGGSTSGFPIFLFYWAYTPPPLSVPTPTDPESLTDPNPVDMAAFSAMDAAMEASEWSAIGYPGPQSYEAFPGASKFIRAAGQLPNWPPDHASHAENTTSYTVDISGITGTWIDANGKVHNFQATGWGTPHATDWNYATDAYETSILRVVLTRV